MRVVTATVVVSGTLLLGGCPAFAPGDLCGYQGLCGADGSPEAGDGGAADDAAADSADGAGDDGDAGASDAPTDGPWMDVQPVCDLMKDPKDSPACVNDAVGVFVSAAGSDGNLGTKLSPVLTLTKAFALASASSRPRVYVCEGNYTQSAELKVALGIYGGFKCLDWSYTGTKPKFAGAMPGWVLHVDGVAGAVVVEDLELDGADVPVNAPGGSSVAVFVNASSAVSLVRLALVGGTPRSGANGTPGNFVYPDASTTLRGNGGVTTQGGAANTYVQCPGGGSTTGGSGGNMAGPGDAGLPNYGGGQGGNGQCGLGGEGSAGNPPNSPASNGVGAANLGALTPAGWAPAGGSKGASGSPGQGGGGGASGVGAGGGGGGGGAGGCGGAGGGPSGGGGGSIALVSLGSTVSVGFSTLTAKAGANGGNGVAGQSGQVPGGGAGAPALDGCWGGVGGGGGAGGASGGGAGGVSVGVLYGGTKPVLDVSTQGAVTVGAKGLKGVGGAGNPGVDGVAQPEFLAP